MIDANTVAFIVVKVPANGPREWIAIFKEYSVAKAYAEEFIAGEFTDYDLLLAKPFSRDHHHD